MAVDRDNGNNLLAFQHLSTRERGSKDGNIVQNIKVETLRVNCICDHVSTAYEFERKLLCFGRFLRLIHSCLAI